MRATLLYLCATATALAAAFFLWYTVRLVYINVAWQGVAARRGGGMLIGAVAFPLAVLVFGWICWRCVRAARGPAR